MKSETTPTMNRLPLERYVEAVRDDIPDPSNVAGAQGRLMSCLNRTSKSNRIPAAPWGWATAAVLAFLIVPLVLDMPGSSGGLAFAQVQSFFSEFRTMHAHLTTSMNGQEVMTMDIVVDDRDRARIDTGQAVSLIIDPTEQIMLQLFHGARRAARVPLEHNGAAEESRALDWLAEIREYQGQSRLIDETRRIDGSEVFGFRLTEHAIDMTLWATEPGRPVLLEMQTGPEATPVTTRIRFDFDRPVDPQRFSLDVPPGYSIEKGMEDT